MMDEDEDLIEAVEASDDEDDEKSHAKLLDAISGLDGKKINKRSQRTVPTNQVSEFNFTAPTEDAKVQLHELMGTLKTSTKHGSLKSKLNRVQNQRVVPVPLPRHQKEKIEREVAYSKTTQEISKWDSVVRSNRQAEQLQFPLQKSEVHLLNTTGKFKNFKPRTPLELEVAAVLNGNRDDLPTKKKELTPAEERALAAMSLEEARERRAELQKFRALMSYKEAKAKRQKRIKSKKYHRVLKKEKLKHEKKALEEMEKNDPEGYLEKLEEVERQRIEERMSLKHRGGSKYSKKQMLYAKYDDQARQRVQDMLVKSRQLTQKTVAVSDSEEEEENEELDSEEEMMERQLSSMSSNPWMKAQAPAPTRSEFSRPEVVLNSEGKEEEEESDDVSDEDEDVLMKMGKELQKRQEKMEVAVHSSGEQQAEREGKLEDPEKEEQIVFDHSEIGKNRSSKNLKKQKKNKKKGSKNVKENIDEIFQKLEEKVEDEGKTDNIETRKKKKPRKKKKAVTEEKEEEEMDDAPLISEGLRRKKTLEEIEEDGEDSGEEDSHSAKSSRKHNTKRDSEKTNTQVNGKSLESVESKEEVFVDPKKLFTLETKISDIANPDITGQNMEEESDEEEAQRSIIAQAFADDDVIDEFVKEKNSIVDRDKPSDLDLFLPGWGCWGGEGVKVSQKKRKRFVIKAPEGPPRKDSRLGNVIISEKKDKAISKHQVSELPFPYVSVDQYEQSIRAPVGKNWNPETAVKELVKPKIITKLGSIIQPISKADVFKNDSKKRRADMSVQDQTVGSRKHKKRKK